jgi:hypothetical protein
MYRTLAQPQVNLSLLSSNFENSSLSKVTQCLGYAAKCSIPPRRLTPAQMCLSTVSNLVIAFLQVFINFFSRKLKINFSH